MSLRGLVSALLVTSGCLGLASYPEVLVDGGVRDAGGSNAGAPDAGASDAAAGDSGSPTTDAGPLSLSDSGVGEVDAGAPRTDGGGPGVDSGEVADAGGRDAGGGVVDAGSGLGGLDASAGHATDTSCSLDAGLSSTEKTILQMPADSWLVLPNTRFSSFCEPIQDLSVHGSDGCQAVVVAWSGAIFDDNNRQLVLAGGGHGNYSGNEVYGFSLATGSWSVLRDPTTLAGGHSASEPMYDGTPVSRHTYGGLAYLSDLKQMFMFGGATAPIGDSVNSVWRFDLTSHGWVKKANGPSSGAGHFYLATAYNPVARELYLRDEKGIWVYDVAADTWDQRVDYTYPPYSGTLQTYAYRSAVYVPSRHWFIAAGDHLENSSTPDLTVYDTLQNKELTSTFTMTGDVSVVSKSGVGLAYDPTTDSLVAWGHGAPGVMNLDSRVWQRGSAVGAPSQDPRVQGGTFGRFRYVEYLNAFVLVSSPTEDVAVYKLSAGCGK